MPVRLCVRFCLGVCLVLLCTAEIASLSLLYRVRKGDTVASISRLFRMSAAEVRRFNGLRDDRVRPGQLLRLGPEIPEVPAPNGPFYWKKPAAESQQGPDYVEPAGDGPAEDYQRGRTLMRALDIRLHDALKGARRLPLSGWKIAIDPGHGGADPGAIVPNTDGENRSVYVVEDEYVHDIALRLYERLRLLGAEVLLTVLSPNHLTRDNAKASVTFVHEQNEVYNDEPPSRQSADFARPSRHNLHARVRIANRFFEGAPRGKTLFLSLHADNSPERPKGPLVIYLQYRRKIDARSRAFAGRMQRALDEPGRTSQARGRNLGVLRGNRAAVKVLIEIRNVHDRGEAWALRFHENRQKDADRIAEGVLAYARRR